MKDKKFDCVQMKHAAQELIRARVQGMTPEEEIAFFRSGAEEFERRRQAARAGRARTTEQASPGPPREQPD